ncbi:VC2046/SO_2500 family protein [Psychromonas sp. KJ10-10]|uniref:VC2046/SO_2500 family protein n=1 Tax=Psychromonas sp. KJ10-10 TaxID=3391823 RepID=UPI0039B4F672
MNNNQIENGLLINEWQLGTQLNVAVTKGTRDKFNLLLSLMSDNACDFSQFDLPKATQGSLTEVELRESLALREPQPLVNAGNSLPQSERISIALHKKDLLGVRLQSLLNNEAVLSRSREVTFDDDVVDNLSFLSQARLKGLEEHNKKLTSEVTGVDYDFLKQHQDLNLSEKPIKAHYV